jgi:DnaK suppressor protein
MTQEKVDFFRRMLESRRADILRALTRVEQEGRTLETDCPKDLGDLSVASLSKEMLFHHSTQHRMLLRNIEGALQRIDRGEFGDCVSCGEQITLKRLEAMPFTQYCRDCQERTERESVAAARSLHRESA